jgi:hypothetical protein
MTRVRGIESAEHAARPGRRVRAICEPLWPVPEPGGGVRACSGGDAPSDVDADGTAGGRDLAEAVSGDRDHRRVPNECHYCVTHHKPFLADISPEGVDRLLEAANPEPDDVDRLVVEYARTAWETPNRIPDGLFERLRRHFSEAQIVELALRIMLCGFFNRFNDALQIEEEVEAHSAEVALEAR